MPNLRLVPPLPGSSAIGAMGAALTASPKCRRAFGEFLELGYGHKVKYTKALRLHLSDRVEPPMSTAPALPMDRRGLPTPVSNLLGSWWLAIAFAALSLLLLWRELPVGESVFGWILVFLVIAVMIAIGTWIAWGICRGVPSALGQCKMLSLIGTGLGLLAVIGFIVVKVTSNPPTETSQPISFMGAANLFLVFALLAALVLPPLMFGLFSWSLCMQDEVERFFFPPPETPAETPTAEALVTPAVVDEAVVEEAVVEEAVPDEIMTQETPQLVVVDKSSVGTLMAEEDQGMQEALAAREAQLSEFATAVDTSPLPVDAELAAPTGHPFSTGSVHIEGEAKDPFATSSATGRDIEKLAKEAQRLDPNALTEEDTSSAPAVEPSELLSITEHSESVSAEAVDASESVLLADEEASALLASGVEQKTQDSKKLPPVPANLDEPLSVGDMELTFDEEHKPDEKK